MPHGQRMTDFSPEERCLFASVDTGLIGQNVCLYCACRGARQRLSRRARIAAVAKILQFPGRFVTFAQTVGPFPGLVGRAEYSLWREAQRRIASLGQNHWVQQRQEDKID